ncbi:MAG TPA: PH domain-containing protein [Streptomyces sp.]|nr:PH domain-containing protein [Streptomyces sp.]
MTREQTGYADHTYRSVPGMVGGTLLLVLTLVLTGDAILRGTGRTPWVALAALLFLAPLITAFSLRPAVYAGDRGLRVRNPFRTITLPWAAVETVRAGYSSEVLADGGKYQLWAIPVSLRQRKKALRRKGGHVPARASALGGGAARHQAALPDGDYQAQADRAIDELRELAERHASGEAAQGAPAVRWAYEILAPAAVGGIALLVLLLG